MNSTREQFPLSSKKILKKTVLSMIGWFIFSVIAFPFINYYLPLTQFLTISSFGFIAGFILLTIITYIYQIQYYQTYFYDLTADLVTIRKGVFTSREITLPYNRIQDVYVDQDIFDRLFGLYDVHLSTATISSCIEAHVDGFVKEALDGLI